MNKDFIADINGRTEYSDGKMIENHPVRKTASFNTIVQDCLQAYIIIHFQHQRKPFRDEIEKIYEEQSDTGYRFPVFLQF